MEERTPEPIAGLIREHRVIEAAAAETGERVAAALAAPEQPALAGDAIEQMWVFQLLLEREVAIHIAKEEQVLFPVLREQVARLSELIDDMLFEHDQIREKRDQLAGALADLEDDHDAVEQARASIRDGLNGAGADPLAALRGLRETVEQLDWIFQGHFTGEEDGLFLPAEDLLSPETMEEMARRMAELEAGMAA